MAVCKGCGRPIIWVKTPGGKSMPCDPDLLAYWEKLGATEKIVTTNGEVVSCEFEGDPQAATGYGRIPHWATCPVKDQFKRKK